MKKWARVHRDVTIRKKFPTHVRLHTLANWSLDRARRQQSGKISNCARRRVFFANSSFFWLVSFSVIFCTFQYFQFRLVDLISFDQKNRRDDGTRRRPVETGYYSCPSHSNGDIFVFPIYGQRLDPE